LAHGCQRNARGPASRKPLADCRGQRRLVHLLPLPHAKGRGAKGGTRTRTPCGTGT
jgi:hypothetical protein